MYTICINSKSNAIHVQILNLICVHTLYFQLGFNIRGGKEHHCGIYVSKVMPNSEADRLGLQEADQVHLQDTVKLTSLLMEKLTK